jgi:hypothetical protein
VVAGLLNIDRLSVVASSGQRAFSRSCCDWLKPLGASKKKWKLSRADGVGEHDLSFAKSGDGDEYPLQAVDPSRAQRCS